MTTTRMYGLGLAAILALLGGCGSNEQAEGEAPTDRIPGVPVTVVEATAGTAVEQERIVGRIESAISPRIDTEVAGTVQDVFVDVGDMVDEGQKLAQLETTDLELALEAAQADVDRLRATYEQQQRTVERSRRLQQQNVLAEGSLEEAQLQLTSFKEQLASAQTRLETARRNLEKATIKAPVTGQVQARDVAPGDYVAPRSVLFQIAAVDRLRVHLPFPETMAGRLRPGLAVTLSSPTNPGQKVEAELQNLRPMITPGNRAIEGIITLDNPGGWLPGATVTADLVIHRREGAVLVPRLAVIQRPAGKVVFTPKDGKAHQVPVEVGVTRGGMAEIRQGLNAGVPVIVDGAGFLSDGAAITVKSQQ